MASNEALMALLKTVEDSKKALSGDKKKELFPDPPPAKSGTALDGKRLAKLIDYSRNLYEVELTLREAVGEPLPKDKEEAIDGALNNLRTKEDMLPSAKFICVMDLIGMHVEAIRSLVEKKVGHILKKRLKGETDDFSSHEFKFLDVV